MILGLATLRHKALYRNDQIYRKFSDSTLTWAHGCGRMAALCLMVHCVKRTHGMPDERVHIPKALLERTVLAAGKCAARMTRVKTRVIAHKEYARNGFRQIVRSHVLYAR